MGERKRRVYDPEFKREAVRLYFINNVKEGPHWDYVDPNGEQFRIWPDGSMTPK